MKRLKKIFAGLVLIQVTQLIMAFFMCAGWGWTWEIFISAYIIPLALVIGLLARIVIEWAVIELTNS